VVGNSAGDATQNLAIGAPVQAWDCQRVLGHDTMVRQVRGTAHQAPPGT